MGGISFSASALLIILGVIGLIAIFPYEFDLLGVHFYFEPLHFLKNTLTYGSSVFLYFAILGILIVGIAKTIVFLKRNKTIQHGAMFLLTFDEKHYNKLRASLR